MKELTTLNRFFVRYKWHVLGGILFVNLSNYFRILQPRMLRHALDTVVKKLEQMKGKNLQFDSPEYTEIAGELLYFGGLVLLFAILMGVFMYLMRQSLIVMSRLVEYDMRKEIFDHYQKLDLAFYRRNKTGDLMSRVTEDVNKVRNYFGPVLMYGVNLISLFSLTIYSMLAISPKLIFFSLLPLPFLVLAIYYVSDQIHKRSTAIQAQLSDLTSEAQEAYSGIRVIKSYAQENLTNDHFLEESNSFREKTLNLAKIDNAFFPIMLIMIGASMILTIYVGGLIIINSHEITYGNIAEFMIYVSMLTWPVTSIGWTASLAQQAAASQRRINEFLNTKPAIFSENVDEAAENKGFDGNIEFQNVRLLFKINDKWLAWNQLSDGTKRIYYVFSQLVIGINQNLICILEEPELGIHPDQLFKLLAFIKANFQNRQIIITTHSPQVLNILNESQLDNIIITKYDNEKRTTVMHHISEETKQNAQAYMAEQGFLSDFWLHHDLEEKEVWQ